MSNHPGAALYTQYQSFGKALYERDRFYRKLDPVDRADLIAYRMKLRAQAQQGRAA